jgi:hypothetical protein
MELIIERRILSTMDSIILASETLVVTKINRRTKAKMFEHLKVGDLIEFSVPIKKAGRNRGTYATYIKATNIKTGETIHSSFNQMPTILNAFEFEPIFIAHQTAYTVQKDEFKCECTNMLEMPK